MNSMAEVHSITNTKEKPMRESKLNAKGKALLNEIDEYLAYNEGAKKLWDVLTALRGPDNENSYAANGMKNATTAVIRFTALPKTARTVRSGLTYPYAASIGARIIADEKNNVEARNSTKGRKAVGSHFLAHTYGAFDALGLSMGGVNE